MRDDTPSRTAAYVAAARGFGKLLPREAQLIEDPYGAAFAGAASLLELGRRMPLVAQMPGMRNWILYMQVRTRVIDDALRAFIDGGGRQVVVLGAGYDARALRLPELAEAGARVFEVDHPATQGRKRRVLERMRATSPATYVTWDFETRPMEDLPEELASAGLDLASPVFTIWEGVTMYLTDAAIDASLRSIRAFSAKGSQLVFTYFAKERLTKPSFVTRTMQAVVSAFGEPWKFGWVPEDLPAFLAERGFTLLRDVSTSHAARELLPPEHAIHVPHRDRRIALAAAPESIALAT